MINKHKLENLLIANWTSFLNIKQLMALVMKAACDLPTVDGEVEAKGTQINLSRFEPTKTGFTVWIEFHVGTTVGTCEIDLTPDGTVVETQVVGRKFRKNLSGHSEPS